MSTSEIKDLHSLLRPKLGDELTIESCKIEDLLPPGENYGSKLVRIHGIIRRDKKSKSEDIWLVAKLPPTTQLQREMFDSPFTFKKESFMYEEILPAYKKLDFESGISAKDTFDIAPEFYGSRLSLNPDDNFDDNAAIILDNLKVKNYYSVDRRLGCDLPHAKLTIKALAKFHAFGLAMKEKNPEFFEVLKVRSKCLEFKHLDNWASLIEMRLKDIASDSAMSVHYELCEKLILSRDFSVWTDVPKEPWSTIIHADFWTNNIMFHKPENSNEPDDIKFVDFQNYLFLSPIRELSFFLGSGLNHDTIINNVDELIELYYDTIIEKLQQLDCNTEEYSRVSFNERVKIDASIEFIHCAMMLKVITMDIHENDPNALNIMNLFENNERNDSYLTRLRNLVTVFYERGWLSNS